MRTAVEPIGRMTPYGPEHLAILVFTPPIAVGLVLLGRRIRDTEFEDRVLRALGWVMLVATVGWTICLWAGIALVANAITGANYGYLSRGPDGASILDLLGPWPIYIFWEAVIVAVVWALMTWP